MITQLSLAAGVAFALLPFASANPANGIAQVQDSIFTAEACAAVIEGYTAAYDPSDNSCTCQPTDLSGLQTLCGGATPDCVAVQDFAAGSTTPSSSSSSCVAHLTTCAGQPCGTDIYTFIESYDNSCTDGQVLSTTCGCVDPTDPTVITIPDNSYRTCTIYVTLAGAEGTTTGFECIAGYATSTDGTSCVLQPTAATRRRALDESRRAMKKRESFVF